MDGRHASRIIKTFQIANIFPYHLIKIHITAEKLLIIASIAPHLESQRVIPHNFNVEDLTKK